MLGLALALDERQQNLLMTLNETLKDENNNKHIDNKINEILTKDKVHSSNNINRNVIMQDVNKKQKNIICKRGEIFYSDLAGNQGSEQGGYRPVIIIQNDVGNTYSPTTIVAVFTSQVTKAKLPTHLEISAEQFGLEKDSVILFEQIRTLDKKRLREKIGMVDEFTMKKVDKALGVSVGLIVEEQKQKTPIDKLPQNIQNIVKDKLDDIRCVERTICNVVRNNEFLKNDLLDEKECYLLSLQRICEKYNINYKDYYTMYKKEEEKIIV